VGFWSFIFSSVMAIFFLPYAFAGAGISPIPIPDYNGRHLIIRTLWLNCQGFFRAFPILLTLCQSYGFACKTLRCHFPPVLLPNFLVGFPYEKLNVITDRQRGSWK
ncbi:MAG: hypothetical protein L0Y74_07090, partial [candidate division Zixibacteria bacterium]|nr:hypothetical protein [candidate division Zixibacteria bacterium]